MRRHRNGTWVCVAESSVYKYVGANFVDGDQLPVTGDGNDEHVAKILAMDRLYFPDYVRGESVPGIIYERLVRRCDEKRSDINGLYDIVICSHLEDCPVAC